MRAKQFMPFAALKGYEEALRAKERIIVDKKELSSERKDELDSIIRQIKKGDMVTVIYYCKEEYLKITGMVSRLDLDSRLIQIVDTKIDFDNVFSIETEQ